MAKNKIRLLSADEIECRISLINAKGLSLLLYKDARVDQRILDETFGLFGWKRSHQCIDGNLYCTVEVFNEESGEWVSKQDVGTTGYAEKEKSQASDSFKRACFNWGIGRELYTAPFIWVSSKDAEIRTRDGKYYCKDRFSVSAIGYNADRGICSLSVVNESKNGNLVYEFLAEGRQPGSCPSGKKQPQARHGKIGKGITERQLHTLEAELQRTGVGMDAVKGRYGFGKPQDMSEELYNRVMNALAKTKSAEDVA